MTTVVHRGKDAAGYWQNPVSACCRAAVMYQRRDSWNNNPAFVVYHGWPNEEVADYTPFRCGRCNADLER